MHEVAANDLQNFKSKSEILWRERINELYAKCPIPEDEKLQNLGLFLNRQTISRIMFMNEMYKKILNVHGIIIEFGVRWGQNLALFSSFRGMYEPYNHNRKIVGFDTFEGFPSVHEKDGKADFIIPGAYSVSENYENYLNAVLTYHESESPLSHIRKFNIVKGNAIVELERYLEKHPETMIALAYFDFDLYEPTQKCLELIRAHLVKGSIVGFDELNLPEFPGETLALKEVLGLDRYRIFRSIENPNPAYLVYE